jgi:N-acetylneuraminate synthase
MTSTRTSRERRCLIIGEVAQAHEGSLGLAHAYIDAIATAGASAVKFQTHLATAESTVDEPWRVKFSVQDASRFEYWRRMEFSEAQWAGLQRHACERGLLFLSSPFSMEAVSLLERVGVAAWKVASGETGNTAMLDRMAASGLPMLLSSGLSSQTELDAAVRQIQSHGAPLTVLQTTSAYPCPPEKVGLNMLGSYRARYGCDVGLSDHSGTIFPSLAAATLGVEVIEVHVTMSREMFGPDVTASVTTTELRQLVDGVRFIEQMNAAPVDKDAMALDLSPMRQLFTRSLALRTDLPAGTVLEAQHLAVKKPGTGLPPSRLPDVLGRRLARNVRSDTLLREADLVEELR